MWVRSVATLPSPIGALVEALGRLTPDTLAALAQAASRDGCHLTAHLARPVRRDEITTFHLRWWNDRSLTPAVGGELALRPTGPQSTELAITAQYRCREALRELVGSTFMRRVAESVVTAFLVSLVKHLDIAERQLVLQRGTIRPCSPPTPTVSLSIDSGNLCERVKRLERLKT